MATSIASAPQSDPLRIYLGPGFQIGDCATPIGDLPPGINVLSRFAAADAEGPVVVEQHHEAGISEGLGEPCDAVFLHAGVAVGHGDGRATLRIALRKIEPGAKFYAVVDKSDFTAGGHRDLLIAFSARQGDPARIDCLLRAPRSLFADWVFVATRADPPSDGARLRPPRSGA